MQAVGQWEMGGACCSLPDKAATSGDLHKTLALCLIAVVQFMQLAILSKHATQLTHPPAPPAHTPHAHPLHTDPLYTHRHNAHLSDFNADYTN